MANINGLLSILNTHINNTTNHMSDKSDEYGFSEHQNQVITTSKVYLTKIEKYKSVITSYITLNTSKNKPIISRDKQKQLIKITDMIFVSFEAIVKDVDCENYKNDDLLLREVSKLRRSVEYLTLLSSIGHVNRVKKINRAFDSCEIECSDFIEYKKTKRLSFFKNIKEKAKTFGKNLPSKRSMAKITLQGLGGTAGILAAKSAALFFKSPGLDKLKYPFEIFLGKVAFDVKKQRDARLHLKQNIERLRADLESQSQTGSIPNALAGGTKGWITAKRNTSGILGEGRTKKEKYAINTNKGMFKGTAYGPTRFDLNKGESIWAGGSGGKSTISNDFSTSLGGGTEVESTNPIVHAINTQTSVLLSMLREDKNYHEDQIARLEDLENSNKGYKSTSSTSNIRKDIIGDGNKGNIFSKLIQEGASTFLGSLSGTVLGSGVSKIISYAAPAIGAAMPTMLTLAVAAGSVKILSDYIKKDFFGEGNDSKDINEKWKYNSVNRPDANPLYSVNAPVKVETGNLTNYQDSVALGTGGSRSWRNNNPGNLEYSKFSKEHGAIGSDGRFAIFPDYATGKMAQEDLLFRSKNYKDLNFKQAINRYAPKTENRTDEYISFIARETGIDVTNKKMKDFTLEEQSKIQIAIQKMEGWKPGIAKAFNNSASLVNVLSTGTDSTTSNSFSSSPKATPIAPSAISRGIAEQIYISNKDIQDKIERESNQFSTTNIMNDISKGLTNLTNININGSGNSPKAPITVVTSSPELPFFKLMMG